jgi:predicted lipoprotein with Yx(FWY)xxD motif
MRLLLIASLLVTLLVPATAAARPRSSVVVKPSAYGPVLYDGRGYALYLFTKDGKGRSRCYGACARAWPPYIAKGRPRAGAGATKSLVGTVKRRDGRRQVTYAGQPLYYYVGDGFNQIRCQNVVEFGGTWLVVAASGLAVR